MDYKNKYKDALNRVKVINPGTADYEVAVKIFPELKKSKDDIMINFISHELACLRATDEKGSDRYEELTNAIAWLEKQGEQKPINKVEPKFKVGDIIVNEYGFIMQIDGIDDDMYVYHLLEGNILLKHDITKTEESCHLWTSKDTKNGDVLATRLSPEGDWIGIYKESVDILGFKTYCFLSAVGEFVINPNRCRNHGTHGLHPATKEQRYLLYSKMKEAGYEWDAEKKELKRINELI